MTRHERLIQPNQISPLNILGTPTTILLNHADTAGLFSLFDIHAYPNQGVPLHYHTREDETFYILSGLLKITIDNRDIFAGPGTTLYSPRGQRHAWSGASTEPARFLVTATPSGMEDMFQELHRLPDPPPDMSRVLEICNRFGIHFA